MQRYILRRILLMIPVFILVSLAAFTFVRILPGDIVTIMVDQYQYADTLQKMRHMLGLDRPWHVQYFEWMGGVLRGDLGMSVWTKLPVVKEVARRWSVTTELATLALGFNLLVGIPAGFLSAIRQDTIGDYVVRALAILGIAIPTFWVGTLVVTLPAVWFGWMPPVEYMSLAKDPLANLGIMIIPAIIQGFSGAGLTARLLRATLLEVLRQDYIRTAWAKGLQERGVLYKHAAKNALIPVVTLIGVEIPVLLGGTVVLEKIFDLPGMGHYVLDLLERRDYVPIQSVVLLFAGVVMIVNLLVDISYAYLDPRIRYH